MTLPFSDEDQAKLDQRYPGRLAGLHVIAREVLPFGAAGGQDWLRLRRTSIGASEIACVMGVQTAPASAFTLWWRKRNGWEMEPEERMSIGLKLEGVIGDLFAEARPDVYLARPRGALYAHPTFAHVTCSPDFLGVIEVDGTLYVVPVECKSDEGGGWGPQGSDDVPAHHRAQALWQATVFGSPFAFVARLAGKRFRWYVIHNDVDARDVVNHWIVASRDFLYSVTEGVPPPPDASESTEDTLKVIFSDADDSAVSFVDDDIARDYLTAAAARRHAKLVYQRAVNRLRLSMGNAATAQSSSYGTFVRRERYHVPAHARRASTVDRLMPVERKGDE